MKSLFFNCLNTEVHVRSWGDPKNFPLICWHGVSRNGGDFTFLARLLKDKFYVIAPDTPGRGLSAWEDDPENYKVEHYILLIQELVQQMRFEKFAFLGTSMGGTLGYLLAATHFKEKMTHLILNDIGPMLYVEPLKRIGSYLSLSPEFDTMADFKTYLQKIHGTFGPLTESEWMEMAFYSCRKKDNGKLTHHYDTGIAENFKKLTDDINLFAFYDQVVCPTLLIRGGMSDLLTEELAKEMCQRGPKATLWTIDDAGHAPLLHREEEALYISRFLSA